MISFDEFKKIEVTVGKILSAEKVPETDKLLKLSVDFGVKKNPSTPPKAQSTTIPVLPLEKGESDTPPTPPLPPKDGSALGGREGGEQTPPVRDIRQIISGIAMHFPDPQTLVGRKCIFVTNLEPRMIKGLESNGMLFAVSTNDGKFSLLEPNAEIPEGTRAR